MGRGSNNEQPSTPARKSCCTAKEQTNMQTRFASGGHKKLPASRLPKPSFGQLLARESGGPKHPRPSWACLHLGAAGEAQVKQQSRLRKNAQELYSAGAYPPQRQEPRTKEKECIIHVLRIADFSSQCPSKACPLDCMKLAHTHNEPRSPLPV